MTDVTTIAFAPLLGWPWLLALVVLALPPFGYALLRRAPGTGWRLLAYAAGVLALVNPALVREERQPLDDVAVVVADVSPSQGVGKRSARMEAALNDLEARLAKIPHLQYRVVRSGDEDASSGAGTQLLPATERALADVPRERVAGVLMLTDGQVQERAGSLENFAPGGPVHVLLTGEHGERDRRLVVEQAPRYGIVGEEQTLSIRVEDQGEGGPQTANVEIRMDERVYDHFRMPIGRTQNIPFKLEHGGTTVIEIDVDSGPSELTERNNHAVVVVNGVRDRLRVLLVSGEPHAGERTWRNILKSDPSVDLVHFTILRPPEKQDGTPIRELSLISFPTRELFQTKLDEFDLVIFDRYRRRGVLPDIYLKNVVDYVRHGGAVLVAAGPAFATPFSLQRTPLAEILPSRATGAVFMQGYRPRLTALGHRHPVTASLPGSEGATPTWGRWFRMIDVERASGDVLLQGIADRPVLILDRVGDGRVAQLLSDHVWLWARGFEGGGPQAELLRRISHWLMKEPDLEEEELRAVAQDNRLEITRRSLTPGPVKVEVVTPSGARKTVALKPGDAGLSRGTLAVSEPGLYRLSNAGLTAVAAVGELNPKEYADLRTTGDVLAPLAQRTGGDVRWLVDGVPSLRSVKPGRDAHGRGWLGLVANGDYLVTGVAQVPLLPALLVLLLTLGLLMWAWRREGR